MGPHAVIYKEKEYESFSALCRAYGKNVGLVKSRRRYGWSLEMALETPVAERESVMYKDVEYPSLRSLCAKFDKNYSTVLDRVNRGWSLEDAIETDDSSNRTPVVFGSVRYRSIASACDSLGVSNNSVAPLMRGGMSFEEAVNHLRGNNGKAYKFDKHEFSSKAAIAKYIGVSKSFIESREASGMSFEEACKCAVDYVNSVKILQVGLESQRRRLKARLNGDIEKCNTWLEKIFLDYPTEFYGRVYSNVESACKALGDLRVESVRNAMLHLLTFQEAVHKAYYVVDGIVIKGSKELGEYLGVGARLVTSVMKVCETRDEVVAELVKHRGSSEKRISGVSSEVAGFISCEDNVFVAYCSVCGRPVVLTMEELCSFKHLDSFCESHTQLDLYQDNVSFLSFKARVKRYGYAGAIEILKSSRGRSISLVRAVNKLSDVAEVASMLGGRYALIRCAICGRNVLLSAEEAKCFKHSNKCEEYEWVDG